MPFIILSCAAPIPEQQCEGAIRELLSTHGEVGGILIARRGAGEAPWVAAVEMRSGLDTALAALSHSEFRGYPLRIRRAMPIDLEGMSRAS